MIIRGFSLTDIYLIDMEVVVYQGTIREKPSCEAEGRKFIKGLLNWIYC